MIGKLSGFTVLIALLFGVLCCTEAPERGEDILREEIEGMVWIPAGEITHEGKEKKIAGFYMDTYEVTVGQFRKFIEATDYKTDADKYGWSGVFNRETMTWDPVAGANWAYPLGPEQQPAANDEPVTQVSWFDAKAYADWAGKQLPTELEWLYAASRQGKYQYYNWGEELLPDDQYRANWWQGIFPYEDTGEDGFLGVAPVGSFPADESGLYDITGNVWEWTVDLKNPEAAAGGAGESNPEMIIKGGSFLCSANYCAGYQLSTRQYTPKDSGLNHLGFRCIKAI